MVFIRELSEADEHDGHKDHNFASTADTSQLSGSDLDADTSCDDLENDVSTMHSSRRSVSPDRVNMDFIGATLVSSDGLYSVPFVSSCFSWSLNVPWMRRMNPTDWLKERLAVRNSQPHLNAIFSPLLDYLVYKNRTLVESVERTPFLRVKQDVINITYGTVNRVDAIGNASGPMANGVCAAHVMSQFTDKLMWAYDLKNDGKGLTVLCLDDAIDDSAPVHLCSEESSEADSKKLDKLYNIKKWHDKFEDDWRSVVLGFIQGWNEEQKRSLSAIRARLSNVQTQTSTAEVGRWNDKIASTNDAKTFLSNVYQTTERHYRVHKVSKAVARILDAVLALSSFRLFDIKKCEGEKHPGSFAFHHALL